MGPSKKSRVVNKNLPKFSEEWPYKDGKNAVKSKIRKRKLSEMLGSQWSKVELEHFYEAYRKYGKDWKKVAATLRNRSSDEVQALFNMNKAYLSLPEGTATAAGLIATMIDQYNIMEGSNSDQEKDQVLRAVCRPRKHSRMKSQLDLSKGSKRPVFLQKQSTPSSSGCLSLLSKSHSADIFGGGQTRAVGKRTPRLPVLYFPEKIISNDLISPNKQSAKSKAEVSADEGMHVAALALAEASQICGLPQVSQNIDRGMEQIGSSPVLSGDSKMVNTDSASAGVNGCSLEGTLANMEAGNVIVNADNRLWDTHGSVTTPMEYEVQKLQRKRPKGTIMPNHQVDVGGFYIDTEEGVDVRSITCIIEGEDREETCACGLQDPMKKPLPDITEDERSALDALQALADLSHELFPTSTSKSELRNHGSSRSKVRKDREYAFTIGDHLLTQKTKIGSNLPDWQDALLEAKQKICPISETPKGKGMPMAEKVLIDEGVKSRASQPFQLYKQGNLSQKPEFSLLNSGIGGTAEDKTIPTKPLTADDLDMHIGARSRCKLNLKNEMVRKELKSSHRVRDECHNDCLKLMNMKGTLLNCLSSQLVRRWCTFEWFYSAIDYPWFAKNDFVEYLNHARLGHLPRLTRVEWSIIRRSLGKARRLSKRFLTEERMKLEGYRESVRTHYAELRAGVREGLPRDLAIPLSVGQCVIAHHPKTGEIHDGSIVDVDRSCYWVQFDRSELGVESVKDSDCMPLDPWENMPDDLRRQNALSQLCKSLLVEKTDGHFMQQKMNDIPKFASKEILAVADGGTYMPSFKFAQTALYKQAKHATCSQPGTLSQMEAKEVEIRAIAELTCALEKKVGSTLFELRQHNTFHGNSTPPWFRSTGNSGLAGPCRAFDNNDFCCNSESHVLEIIETSRRKAKIMVDQQAMFFLEGRKDAFTRIGEALNSTRNQSIGAASDRLDTTYVHLPEVGKTSIENEKTSFILEAATTHIPGPNLQISSDANGGQIPSELISACVAALFMIESCTERRYPPAEVAEILESAVTSLQPYCSQNLPIYRDIETCMGIIKSQMLALIPNPSASHPRRFLYK